MSDLLNTTDLFQEELPEPIQRQGVIHVGTSGFSFDDWKGEFYPRKLPRTEWLEFYSSIFTTVEINATYYRLPTPSVFKSMAERTHAEFGFWVKVPGTVTHGNDIVEPLIDSFLEAIDPLRVAGKLRGVLAQFPNSFRYGQDTSARIVQIKDRLGEVPLAIEFRNSDWLCDETFSLFESSDLIYVVPDLPALKGLPDNTPRVFGRTAYIRLHGRNSKTWYNQSLGDRYDYEYDSDELEHWRDQILRLDGMAESTYIFFNNCHAGQAVKNARMLRQLLLT